MKKRILIIIAIVFGLFVAWCVFINMYVSATSPAMPVADAPAPQQTKATTESLLRRVNEERAKVGVAPLKLDDGLMKSAQLKSDDMVNRNYESHFLPDDMSQIFTQAMKDAAHTNCTNISENYVSSGDGTELSVEQAYSWWLDSPAHKAALLDPKYTSTGFGVTKGIIVEHFCVAK